MSEGGTSEGEPGGGGMSRRGPFRGLVPAILAGLTLRGGASPGGRADSGRGRPEAPGRDPEGPGHETRDVDVRSTARAMAGLALTAVAVVGAMIWLMSAFAASQRRALPALTPQQTARLTPPAPNLQADPYADLDRARAAADARLEDYGYIDAGRTRARIPIARAMELSIGRSLDPAGGTPR